MSPADFEKETDLLWSQVKPLYDGLHCYARGKLQQKYGKDRGRVGNTLGDVPYDQFAKMLGGYGEEVRDPADIAPAMQRARESGLPSLINVWIDPDAYAPGTMNQTMYK